MSDRHGQLHKIANIFFRSLGMDKESMIVVYFSLPSDNVRIEKCMSILLSNSITYSLHLYFFYEEK